MRAEHNIHVRVFHIIVLITLFLAFSCKSSQKVTSPKNSTINAADTVSGVRGRGSIDPLTKLSQASDTLTIGNDSTQTTPPDSVIYLPDKSIVDNPVDYNAEDSIILDAKSKIIYLYKNAQVTYGTIELKAHFIALDMNSKTLHAESERDSLGNIIKKVDFKDADKSFIAAEIDYNFETKKGLVSEVFTQESEGYLHGEKVKYTKEIYKKDTLNVIYTYKGQFTTCNLEEPHFHIAANKIKVIPKKRIVTGPAVFCIEGVPTPAVLPLGFFPNQENRASGLIMPKVGLNNTRGVFLDNGGYYWAVSPKADLSFTGSIFSDGSWGAGVATNYNIKYKMNGSAAFKYFEVVNGFDRADTLNYSRGREFSFRWKHIQDPKSMPGQSFSADVNIVTAGFNKNATLDINSYVQSGFQSNINYGFSIPRSPFNVVIALSHSQNTQSRAFDMTLPQITFNTNRVFPFKPKNRKGPQKWYHQIYEGIGINHQTIIGTRISTQDSLLSREFNNGFKNSFKWGARHSISASNSFKIAKYISVTPAFNYYEYWNSFKFTPIFDQATQTTLRDTSRGFYRSGEWDTRVDISTNIFAFFRFKNEKLKAMRFLATPSLGFVYNPDFNTNIYGFYGTNGAFQAFDPYMQSIYGMAKRTKQGTITLAINSNLEAKVKSKRDSIKGEAKIKIIDAFNVSTAYNFLADSLQLQPLILSLRTSFWDNKISIIYNSVFDPYGYAGTGNNKYRINTFQYNIDKRLMRMTSTRLSVNLVLVGKRKEQPIVNPNTTTPEQMQYVNQNRQMYLDFTVPYNLNLNYNLDINNPFDSVTVNNNINITGDFSLTKNWKIDVQANYDFKAKKFGTVNIGISRNLHCWQMDLNWIPIGPLSSVIFTIRAKPGLLQDLKLNMRRGGYPVGGF